MPSRWILPAAVFQSFRAEVSSSSRNGTAISLLTCGADTPFSTGSGSRCNCRKKRQPRSSYLMKANPCLASGFQVVQDDGCHCWSLTAAAPWHVVTTNNTLRKHLLKSSKTTLRSMEVVSQPCTNSSRLIQNRYRTLTDRKPDIC